MLTSHFPFLLSLCYLRAAEHQGSPGPQQLGWDGVVLWCWQQWWAMIVVSIPAAEPEVTAHGPEKAHTVFLVEVLCNGRRHVVAKRYSEFQALHKRIKKNCKVPDFPPRRVPNWVPKVLEQRRQGLELYIQGILCHNEELPQDVLDFLKVRRCQQEPKGCSPLVSHSPSQRPVLGFCTDPYVQPPAMDALPSAVLSGVLQGLYSPWHCFPCTAVPWGKLGS